MDYYQLRVSSAQDPVNFFLLKATSPAFSWKIAESEDSEPCWYEADEKYVIPTTSAETSWIGLIEMCEILKIYNLQNLIDLLMKDI